MPEQLKELLEKINNEGVKAAQEKAAEVESISRQKAQKIIDDAKNRAKEIVEQAHADAEQLKAGGRVALQQAARNLMLAVKDQIKALFEKIIAENVTATLSGEEFVAIISSLIDRYMEKNKKSSDIMLLLGVKDSRKLKDTFIKKLKERLKEKIEIKPVADMSAGFAISFDNGESYYEFTDESLTEVLGAYLNPELAEILKEAISQ